MEETETSAQREQSDLGLYYFVNFFRDCGVLSEEFVAVTHEDVKEYYGSTIQSTKDLLTSACLLEVNFVPWSSLTSAETMLFT